VPTRNVVLTEHHQEVIERLLETGRYQNASEIVGEALQLIERREELDEAKLTTLQSAATSRANASGYGDSPLFRDCPSRYHKDHCIYG
jgi:putative addiction module CopG family antidote